MKEIPANWKKVEKNKNRFCFEFFPGKKEKIKFIKNPKKPFCACGGIFGIKVDKLFFEELNEKEKIAVLWHELYHKENNWKRIPLLELKSFFGLRFNYNHVVEFEADRYSARKNSKRDCLSFLKTAKRIYSEGKANHNLKTHPPIEERIKKIENLK